MLLGPSASASFGRVSHAAPPAFHFRQTEIQNLRVPAPGHEDVRRLDVAMDDPFACAASSASAISIASPAILRLQRLARDPVLQRLPSRYSMAMKAWPSCSPMS